MNYYARGQLRVRALTSLELRGTTLHLDGTSAGLWEGKRTFEIAPGSKLHAEQAVELFRHRHGVVQTSTLGPKAKLSGFGPTLTSSPAAPSRPMAAPVVAGKKA